MVTQTCPLLLAVQSEHVPLAPHALFAVPGKQVLVVEEQHPAGQSTVELQANTQSLVVLLQELAVFGQSLMLLQPHCPPPVTAMQESPAVPAANRVAQLAQSPPLFPQVPSAVPALQVPLVAAVQQPSLQGWVELQLVVHWCVVVLQAVPLGQSLTLLQPHAPLARQAVPAALPTQLPQTPWPVSAHIAWVFPGWHVPAEAAEQQPPLHTWPLAQLVVHACVVVLQALPVAQSVAALQPQTPLTHSFPAAAVVQSAQAAPASAQAVPLIARHWFVEEQQ